MENILGDKEGFLRKMVSVSSIYGDISCCGCKYEIKRFWDLVEGFCMNKTTFDNLIEEMKTLTEKPDEIGRNAEEYKDVKEKIRGYIEKIKEIFPYLKLEEVLHGYYIGYGKDLFEKDDESNFEKLKEKILYLISVKNFYYQLISISEEIN